MLYIITIHSVNGGYFCRGTPERCLCIRVIKYNRRCFLLSGHFDKITHQRVHIIIIPLKLLNAKLSPIFSEC